MLLESGPNIPLTRWDAQRVGRAKGGTRKGWDAQRVGRAKGGTHNEACARGDAQTEACARGVSERYIHETAWPATWQRNAEPPQAPHTKTVSPTLRTSHVARHLSAKRLQLVGEAGGHLARRVRESEKLRPRWYGKTGGKAG